VWLAINQLRISVTGNPFDDARLKYRDQGSEVSRRLETLEASTRTMPIWGEECLAPEQLIESGDAFRAVLVLDRCIILASSISLICYGLGS
jgi:hypothetical protein